MFEKIMIYQLFIFSFLKLIREITIEDVKILWYF